MKRIGIEWNSTVVDGRKYRRVAPFYEGPRNDKTLARIAAVIAIVAFVLSIILIPDVQL